MALSSLAQVTAAINRARNILIVSKASATHDDVAAVSAMLVFLKKTGRPCEAVVSGFDSSRSPACLIADEIRPQLDRIKNFVLRIDLAKAGLDTITSNVRNGKLDIHLTPKEGGWSKEDISFGGDTYRFDLIIAIGVPDLPSLGAIFEKNGDFFQTTPILNFDHDPANEQFGAINVVNIASSSVSEVLYETLAKIDKTVFDEVMATTLLAGIMSKTRSFKSSRVNPKTLEISSELFALGAKQEIVTQQLFKNKSVATLKLWGRALSRLRYDAVLKLAWTTIVREDFLTAGVDDSSVPDMITDLISDAPSAELVLILWERDLGAGAKEIRGVFHSAQGVDARTLLSPFTPIGTARDVSFSVHEETILKAEEAVFVEIKKSPTR